MIQKILTSSRTVQIATQTKTGFALITRFSLRIEKFLGLAEIKTEQARDDWFRQRSRLFKTITYPSICKQEVLPDKWYLLMSEGDQRLFEAHVNMDEEWIVPLYFNGGGDDELNGMLYAAINDHFRDIDNLIISRIDNDDAVDRKYIAKLRRFALDLNVQEDTFLLFRKGLRWDGNVGEELVYENGPFLTMYSKNWRHSKPNPLLINHSTVLSYPHKFVESSQAMWLQSIHGENLYNAFKNLNSCAPVTLALICSVYGVDVAAVGALQESSNVGNKKQRNDQLDELKRTTMFFPSIQNNEKKNSHLTSGDTNSVLSNAGKKPQQLIASDAVLILELKEQARHLSQLLEQEKKSHMATKEHVQFYKELVQEYREELKRSNNLKRDKGDVF